jgi:hypothetical protein
VQLYKDLREVDKERRRLYEAGLEELHTLKQELLEALQEYRTLRRRKVILSDVGAALDGPALGAGGQYDFPLLEQYLARPPSPPQPRPAASVTPRAPVP